MASQFNANRLSNNLLRLTRTEFLESLRLKLLIDPFHVQGDITCPQCGEVSMKASPLHSLDCNFLKPIRNYRHDTLRDFLLQLLKAGFPNDRMEIEKTITTCVKNYKADVYWEHDSTTHIFDVAIVDPSAPTYRTLGSHHTPDVAATERETYKTRLFLECGVHNAVFIPFVVEATGRLGVAARNWFESMIADTHKKAGNAFISRISASIARYNSKMITGSRSLFRIFPW